MHWFRLHRRLGTWVALIALVLQLGLSFGHVHGLQSQHLGATPAAAADNAPVPANNSGDTTTTTIARSVPCWRF